MLFIYICQYLKYIFLFCLLSNEFNSQKEKQEKKIPQDNQKKDQQKPHVLGLFLVKQIVESHNGKINFIFVNQKVNQIEILLPLSL